MVYTTSKRIYLQRNQILEGKEIYMQLDEFQGYIRRNYYYYYYFENKNLEFLYEKLKLKT